MGSGWRGRRLARLADKFRRSRAAAGDEEGAEGLGQRGKGELPEVLGRVLEEGLTRSASLANSGIVATWDDAVSRAYLATIES